MKVIGHKHIGNETYFIKAAVILHLLQEEEVIAIILKDRLPGRSSVINVIISAFSELCFSSCHWS